MGFWSSESCRAVRRNFDADSRFCDLFRHRPDRNSDILLRRNVMNSKITFKIYIRNKDGSVNFVKESDKFIDAVKYGIDDDYEVFAYCDGKQRKRIRYVGSFRNYEELFLPGHPAGIYSNPYGGCFLHLPGINQYEKAPKLKVFVSSDEYNACTKLTVGPNYIQDRNSRRIVFKKNLVTFRDIMEYLYPGITKEPHHVYLLGNHIDPYEIDDPIFSAWESVFIHRKLVPMFVTREYLSDWEA